MRLTLLFLLIVTAISSSAQRGVYPFAPFDRSQVQAEILDAEETDGRSMAGKVRYEALNFFDHAVLEDRAWFLWCSAEGADELSIYFDDFHLPIGAELTVSDAFGIVLANYDSDENNPHKKFMTLAVPGDVLLLEYKTSKNNVGVPHLGIMGCGFMVDSAERGNASDFCEVDVNCPEGEEWQCQRDAVVKLLVTADGVLYNCSGSLVNTTALDCRQYLLTALHCAWNVQDDEWAFLQVSFNYETPALDSNNDGIPEWQFCGDGSAPINHNRVGVNYLTDSDDYVEGDGTTGSDFLLLEVEDNIPDEWDPYFAGWDASGWGSSTGVAIHHPSGDVKKISTYGTALQSVWVGFPDSHWEVTWLTTSNGAGVTEPGSSGSPIFNFEHRIIGTLTGGFSACEQGGAGPQTGPNEPDYFGKMNQHFTNNDNLPEQKLKAWLDPLNTNAQVIYGAYRPCDEGASCEIVSVQELLEIEDLDLYPNPTSGNVTVQRDVTSAQTEVNVLYAWGRLVFTQLLQPGAFNEVALEQLQTGVYQVVILADGIRVARQRWPWLNNRMFPGRSRA